MREVGWRYIVAALALFFALFPVAWVVTSAINPLNTLTTVQFLPKSTTFDNFTALFEGCNWTLGVPPFECPNTTTPFPLWLWNTVKISLLATSIQLILSALAAYSFSRLRWRGRRFALITVLLVQMFPAFLAFVALFLLIDTLEETFGEAVQTDLWVVAVVLVVVALFTLWLLNRPGSEASHRAKRWGWIFAAIAALIAVWAAINPGYGVTLFPRIGLGSHTSLILVYLGGAVGVNTWLIKGFMDSIPTSLDEAAKVDGATEWQVFWQIILPLTKPILIVIFILTFVNLYNEFILASVLVQGVDQFTYATGLALFVDSDYAAKWGQMSAAALIGITPILTLFWSLQDRIVSALGGAVKG
jgi:ABC-type maltose transport system permease subunit